MSTAATAWVRATKSEAISLIVTKCGGNFGGMSAVLAVHAAPGATTRSTRARTPAGSASTTD